MIYRFSDLQLDVGRRELSRGDEAIHLTNLSYKVLKALVEAAPDLLSHDELIDRAWGENRVVTPENLTQRIKVLRESLGDDAENPVYIEAVRGQGFRLLPDIVAIAPEGEISLGNLQNRRVIWWILGATTLAILAFVGSWPEHDEAYQRLTDPSSPDRNVSVAVLPFSNLSPDPNNALYAAGLHEEVLNQLAQLSHLGVISRTSMLRYANTSLAIPEIARELDVDTVIEGSVRYADDRIRVTIQLVDGVSDEHIWSETYDRELSDFFEIETDIASNVARALGRVVSGVERSRLERPATTSLEAFGQYVLGNEAKRLRTIEGVQDAADHFRMATEIDPDYALAWAGLAESLAFQVEYGSFDLEESFAPRQRAIDKALEIDPLMGEAWLALTKLQLAQGVITDPEPHYLKVIELSPNYAQAYHVYGSLLAHTYQPGKALPYLEKAVALDPDALAPRAKLAQALHGLKRTEESLELLYRGVEQHPGYPGFYRDLNGILSLIGRLGEAMYWIDIGARLPSSSRYVRGQKCRTLASLNAVTEAEDCYAALVRDFPRELFSVLSVLFLQPDLTGLERAFADIRDTAQLSEWMAMMRAYFSHREWERSRQILEGVMPVFFSNEPVTLDDERLYPAVYSGMLLHYTGESARADYLFELVLEYLEGVDRIYGPAMRIGDVVIHAVRGERELANAALRDVYDSGWRWAFYYLSGPQFDLMKDDPEWEALIAEFEADLARQLQWYEQHKNYPVSKVGNWGQR